MVFIFQVRFSVIDSEGIFLLIHVPVSYTEIYQNQAEYNEEGFLSTSTKSSRKFWMIYEPDEEITIIDAIVYIMPVLQKTHSMGALSWV